MAGSVCARDAPAGGGTRVSRDCAAGEDRACGVW
jgi:hypothetical protein